MKFGNRKLPHISFAETRFFLFLLCMFFVVVIVSRTSNALGWTFIICLTMLLVYLSGLSPFAFLGLRDRDLTLQVLLWTLFLLAGAQMWRILINYIVFSQNPVPFVFFSRLRRIWTEGLLQQGFGEELVFRLWILLPVCRRSRWVFWLVFVLQTGVFVLFHTSNLPYFLFAFGFALMSGIAIFRSRSLIPGFIAHTLAPLYF
ncbi:MAG: CPBP family intramembrane metalloprotease [Candidatus Aminicenantes bacterium]|nr:CPBP family intramembrane metalloprotease [Candidatus Aminicenantes bacterium]